MPTIPAGGSLKYKFSYNCAKRYVKKSANFGFQGATCIHPKMVDALNRGFSPTKEEIDEATLIIEVMKDAWQNNRGAAQINGKMIDMPVYRRAKAVVKRVDLINKKHQHLP